VGKNGILFLLTVLIGLLMAGNGLYAVPLLIDSPQGNSTAGRFGSDADDFMSVRGWANVDFDRWFTAVSFFDNRSIPAQWATLGGTGMAQLGFATRFGNVYTAISYTGNAWRGFGARDDDGNFNIFDHTVQTMPFFGTPTSMRLYGELPELSAAMREPMYNDFSVLIGVRNMGFRFSVSSTYQSQRINETFAVGTGSAIVYHRSLRQELGRIIPEVAWGMTQELVPGRGITPMARVTLNINRDSIWREVYNFDGTNDGVSIARSQNNMNLGVFASLGGFSLYEIADFRWSVDFEYGANLFFFNNNFSFRDAGNNWQTGTIRGGELTNAGVLRERSIHIHTIVPSMSVSWSGDGIKLASRFRLNTRLEFENTTNQGFLIGDAHNGTLVNNGRHREDSIFTFAPAIDLGMQWAIVPERFFLNVGGIITLGRVTLRSWDDTVYTQGSVNPGSQLTDITNTFNRAETRLLLGFTFNITHNVELQATGGVNSANNGINVFDATSNGIFHFTNILATMRF